MINEKDTKIYIVLSYSGSMVSKALKIATRREYTHVSISIDSKLDRMYSFARLYRTPLPGGFVVESAISNMKYLDTKCIVYELSTDIETYINIENNIAKFTMESNKYSYNLIGLAGAYIGMPIEREKSYFCSQFVSEILKVSGINIIEKPSGLVKPADFMRCGLVEVYRGKLSEYEESSLTTY